MKLGFLRIQSFIPDNKKQFLIINDKELELNDKNLPIFSKVAKLLRTITEKKNGFKVSDDYLKSEDSSFNLFGVIENIRSNSIQKTINDAHEPEVSRYVAYKVNEDLQRTMAKYFGCNYDEVCLGKF